MGYETAFSLTVTKIPGTNAPLSDQYLEQIADALDDLGVMEYIEKGKSSVVANGYCKWYDYGEDMTELSKKFPQAMFELYGDGEDSDDFWRNYYIAGAEQGGYAQIVYPALDLDALLLEAGIEKEETDSPPINPGGDLSVLMGVSVDEGGDG